MKKILLIAALAAGAMTAQAQVTVLGSKFSDNWSITLKGGAVSPMKGHGYWENARGIFGAELRKQITPTFGLGVEGEWTVNTSSWYGDKRMDVDMGKYYKSPNGIDHQYVGVFGTLNFMNMFAGYAGSPRVFELEAVAGTGWLHSYNHGCKCDVHDGNSWANKVGLNFNFNLGASKAWTLSLKPAILWNMGAAPKLTDLGYSAQYDSRAAYVEMEAGITYHFKNSNGTHSFKIADVTDPAYIQSLLAQIENQRMMLDQAAEDAAAAQARYNELLAAYNELLNQPKVPEITIITEELVETIFGENYYKRYIFFPIGSSTISTDQMPEVYLVADLLNKKPEYQVTINGYASPYGATEAFNQKLSQKRADAAKNALVKYLKDIYNYDDAKINEQVLDAEGKGQELISPFDSELTAKLRLNNHNQWNQVAVYDVDFKN